MQIATELRDDDWLPWRNPCKAWIGILHLKRETLYSIAGSWGGWSIGAERDPIAILISGKIILELVPLFLRFLEPVHVPDPLQIICALGAHQIDNMPVSRDVARRTFLCATVPFTVPAKPVSVWFGPPLN